MSWRKVSIVSQRRDFVTLFNQPGANRRELCRRFGIQARTGYKWARRYLDEGEAGLEDRSRRPHRSPQQTCAAVEERVVAVRDRHPSWGARKIRRWLQDFGLSAVPAVRTTTAILHRHGRIDAQASAQRRALQRFERAAPNELWQMDFKGHFATAAGRCHALTVLDDHSRYSLGIQACADERRATVQQALTAMFRRYGLPDRMLMDNGAPWGSDEQHRHTGLTVWLMQLGIAISHGRPYHPQTQGKDERFHRTLKAEVIGRSAWRDLAECQRGFDAWRTIYNHERPHQALDLATPATRYRSSWRSFPERLEPFDYGPGALVRTVDASGWASFRNHPVKLGKAFRGERVAFRPTLADGIFEIAFQQFTIAQVDLAVPDPAEGG